MKENEIINSVLAGNINDFSGIVELYSDKINRYVNALGVRSGSEDIVQEVFIKVYENLNEYNGSLKFSSWIYRIAHNVTIDYFRKNKIKVIDYDFEDIAEFIVDNKNKLIEDKIIERRKHG